MGIHRDTPEPLFGKIEKDENGEPTGFLYETAVQYVAEAFTFDEESKKQIDERNAEEDGILWDHFRCRHAASSRIYIGRSRVLSEFEEKGELTTRIHFLDVLDGDLERGSSV